MEPITGAEILIEGLKKEGVKVIFGYPGGVVLNIYDVLFGAKIKHILVRHEQAAVHAADGYARATGDVGVCLLTSGPGATNGVTGIATAYMDSVPLVVITGQVPTGMIGNDAFQEADIVGMTRPCTKHSFLVKKVEDLAETIKEAFYIAKTGKPGPVLIDLPKDVIVNKALFSYPDEVKLPGYNPTLKGHVKQVNKAADLLAHAKRPVFFVGGGIIGAAKELKEVALASQTPVISSLMGLGGFPLTHNLSLGMCGMHGTYAANMAITHSDLLIGIGVRFDDRVTGDLSTFAQRAKIVHVDIDPTSIGKNVPAHVPIVGDAGDILKKLGASLKKKSVDWKKKNGEWLEELKDWKKTNPLGYKQGKTKIKPQFVIEEIYKATKGKAIIATDVGQHQMWTAQFYPFTKPRTFLTSGGLGTMGYGFPAAIGAQAAHPDQTVFTITGDGSIQMNIQELATALQYRLPIKIAILNNGFLGMVRQWQELFYDKRYSQSCLTHPDFVKLAEAYGAMGIKVDKPDQVVPAIEKAMKSPKTVLMDFRVEREENVYPMVPAGAGIDKMILT